MAKLIHNLPIPDLDDKTFEELVDEARAKIPLYASKWTEHNLSDPGITLLELFAWLAEMQIYSLNQLPDKNYLKFLKLLNEKPQPAKPAKVDVTFTVPENESVSIPESTQIVARISKTGEEVIFETDESLNVLPIKLEKIVSFVDLDYTDYTDANSRVGVFYHAFGKKAEDGSILYLGFDNMSLFSIDSEFQNDLDNQVLSDELREEFENNGFSISSDSTINTEKQGSIWLIDDKVNIQKFRIKKQDEKLNVYDGIFSGKDTIITVYLYEIELSSRKEYDQKLLENYPAVKLVWEYWQEGEWRELQEEDETILFTQNGKISFNIPSDIVLRTLPSFLEDEYYLFWIRCRVEKANYEIPPRIDTIKLNTVSATQGETVKDELLTRKDEIFRLSFDEEISSGLPSQVFQSKNSSIIVGTQKLVVETDGKQENWEVKDDFDASGPEDKHYILRPNEGEILFGDGINGYIPPKGSNVFLTYRFGAGEEGNIPVHAIYQAYDKKGNPIQISVDNERPASGGKEEESIEEAQSRIRKELKIPYRAVTKKDYETIVKNTPGLRVARAYAVPSQNEENLVEVTVVPYSPLEPPEPSPEFLDVVCKHLDKHRLITTNLRVVKPEYIQVSVDATVRIKPKNQPETMKEKIERTLTRFLDPLKGGTNGDGWAFGRTVYQSEIYEVIEDVDGVDCVTRLTLRATGNYQYKDGNVDIPPLSLVYSGIHNIQIREQETVCQ